MNHEALLADLREAFASDALVAPSVTLRGGNAIDDYASPPPFDPSLDVITDEYLEAHHWGVNYLDAASWRHYLPSLFEYALRHLQEGSFVCEALLSSLRPPDRTPPRLASLSHEHEALVVQALDVIAFSNESASQDLACQIMEEWWAPGALYRVIPT